MGGVPTAAAHLPAWATGSLPARPPGTEPTPRPVGVAPEIPYEPRIPYRGRAKADIIERFIELFEDVPLMPRALQAALGVWNLLFIHDPQRSIADSEPEAGSWTFAAIGDYGAGTRHQARVAANIVAGDAKFLVTTGDNVYPTGRWRDYAKNFSPDHLMGQVMRKMPVMPALGNHDLYEDNLEPYFAHFPHLKGRPYYSFVHENALFLSVDTDQAIHPGSAQYQWLEAELAASNEPWKIVYMHYPPVASDSKTGGDDELRAAIAPLMKKYGVQLVLTGHAHHYSRSHAIDGVTYIVTGGGGQIVYPFKTHLEKWIAAREASYHHVEVHVGPTYLVVRAIDERGRLIDEVKIPRSATAQAAQGASLLASDVGT